MNGREAFFALMAMKMMELAKKYHRKLEDMHSLFFMMSCDFQLLEQMLEAQANESMPTGQQQIEQLAKMQWKVLEDLAVKDDKESEAYKHLVELRGQGEVERRRQFLSLNV